MHDAFVRQTRLHTWPEQQRPPERGPRARGRPACMTRSWTQPLSREADTSACVARVAAAAQRPPELGCARQAGVYDAFVEAATERVGKLKLGSGLDPHTTLGPLINARAVDRVRGAPRRGRLRLPGALAAKAHSGARGCACAQRIAAGYALTVEGACALHCGLHGEHGGSMSGGCRLAC
jgi:hypothetical protein